MKAKIIIPVLLFLLSLALANAISFYEGNVIIKSLKADADITDNANVILNYTLSGNEKVNLNFNNVPGSAEIKINGQSYGKSFDFDVKGEISIIVAYSTGLGTEAAKGFSLNPNPLFNNAINSNRIISYSVKIKMPSGVNELLSSSETPSGIETESGRKIFAWQKANAYASTLSINWHSLNVNIDVERIIPARIDDEFDVKNIIRNNGGTISNVMVIQTFLEGDFDPISPIEEFERIQSGNDRRLEWKKEISSIPGGTVKEISYRLKVLNRGESVIFRPLYVYVDGALAEIVGQQEYITAAGSDKPSGAVQEASVPEQNFSAQREIASAKRGKSALAELETGQIPKASPQIDSSQKDQLQETGEDKPRGEQKASFIQNLTNISFPKERKNVLIWTISIMILLLLAVLMFIFLNRRKQEGIRF